VFTFFKLAISAYSILGSRFLSQRKELQATLEKMSQLPRFGSFGDDEALSDFVFVSKR